MAFHLAPTGLPPRSRPLPEQSSFTIECELLTAIDDVGDLYEQKVAYNLSHPDTRALIKGLDAFFSHGFITEDKCYWCYVLEFMPSIEQQEMVRQWNCSQKRQLSIAWIKDSLNRSNLHFQLLAFAADDKLKRRWYKKGACLRNKELLQRVCKACERLQSVKFNIESPYVFRTEDIPIALPASPIHAANATAQSPPTIQISAPQSSAYSIGSFRRGHHTLRNSYVSSTSPFPPNSWLDNSLLADLSEVNLPSSAHEPFPQSAKDQDFMLDEMLLRSHRQRMNGLVQGGSGGSGGNEEGEGEATEPPTPMVQEKVREAKDLFVEPTVAVNVAVETTPKVVFTSESNGSGSVGGDDISNGDDQPDDKSVPIEGEFTIDSGQIVTLAVEVFRESAEKFQRMFTVFMGHSTGQPLLRYLLVTDMHVYLLSIGSHSNKKTALEAADEVKPSSLVVEADTQMFDTLADDRKSVKYSIHLAMSLTEIDCVTVGMDCQVICFHLKRRKHLLGSLEHEKKTYIVETGSKQLGKAIVGCIRQVLINSLLPTATTTETASSTILFTYSTQLAIIMRRFTTRELSNTNVQILHHALVYWQQREPEKQLNADGRDELEGYLYVRGLQASAWRTRYSQWQHSYFIIKGCMLYQFADSSCKFAQRSFNVRQCMDQIFEADLKNDEKYVFEVTLTEEGSGGGGDTSLQFSCPNREVMRKWISNLTVALSASSEAAVPVACMLIVTDSHVMFAQEGASCIVDGFMRPLSTEPLSRIQITSLLMLKTEFHNAMIIQRQDGYSEWIFLRDESELNRLAITFTTKWGGAPLVVEDCNDDDHFSRPQFNSLFKQCTRMDDMWRSVLNGVVV